MGAILIIFVIVLVLLIVSAYFLENWFFGILRVWAERDFLVTKLKEKRTIERRKADVFNKFFFVCEDESFAYQKLIAERRKAGDHSRIVFGTEVEKWEIVEDIGYKVTDDMDWWQKYIYEKTGLWWYQGWFFQYKIFPREIAIYTYDEKAKTIFLVKDKKDPNKATATTVYFFRTWERYAIAITGAEDATGNPLTVFIELEARVRNPYIAGITVGKWDEMLGTKVRGISVPIINKYHYYNTLSVLDKHKDTHVEKDSKIFSENLSTQVLSYLKATENDIGFEFRNVHPQNIVGEREDVVKAVADTFVSEETLKQTQNVALGERAKVEEVGLGENHVVEDLLLKMTQHLPAAKLLTLQKSFGNAKAISLDGKAIQTFMTAVDDDDKTEKNDDKK